MAAIQTATINAAQLLRWEADLGSIEDGKLADIIAVAGNPLDDIRLLEDVKFVMKGGEVEDVKFVMKGGEVVKSP